MRAACGVPVGVTTGAWIEPDLERRLALIGGWSEPDYSRSTSPRTGAERVMRALLERGRRHRGRRLVGRGRGRLAASGLGGRVTRVLVEPVEPSDGRAEVVAGSTRR